MLTPSSALQGGRSVCWVADFKYCSGLHQVPLLSSATGLFFLGTGVASGVSNSGKRTREEQEFSRLQEETSESPFNRPPMTRTARERKENMRKLRRLPWRIPKSNHSQPAAAAEPCPRDEPTRPTQRELSNTQPVAFAGGRYVYGDTPSVSCSTEIRRKVRHRVLPPLAVAG